MQKKLTITIDEAVYAGLYNNTFANSGATTFTSLCLSIGLQSFVKKAANNPKGVLLHYNWLWKIQMCFSFPAMQMKENAALSLHTSKVVQRPSKADGVRPVAARYSAPVRPIRITWTVQE